MKSPYTGEEFTLEQMKFWGGRDYQREKRIRGRGRPRKEVDKE